MSNTATQFKKGEHNSISTEFFKGCTPWNKDKKGCVNSGSFKKGHKMIGISIGERMKGKVSAWKGHKHTEESKEKNRLKHLGKTAWNKGMDSGVTPRNLKARQSIEMKLWRKSVFARDGYTCQKYGTIGGVLRAHHILNFSDFIELRTSISNGITLSEKAHKEFHKKYGTKNNTREQLVEFLDSFIIGQNA